MQFSVRRQFPRDYGVDHDAWRPGQLETLRWLEREARERTVSIVEAPVGSGKSAVGAALGGINNTMALTYTINLQKQYEEEYGFDPIFGMAHYPCALNAGMFNADDCIFPEAMFSCPVASECEYLIQRTLVQGSNRQALSYAYYLTAGWVHDQPPMYLYCDEAHLLPALVKGASTIEFDTEDIIKYDLEPFPTVNVRNHAIRIKIARDWLSGVRRVMTSKYNDIVRIPPANRTTEVLRAMRYYSGMISDLSNFISDSTNRPQDFFAQWDSESIKIIPLTARRSFPKYFLGKKQAVILTSATIGNPKVLASELGIRNFKFRRVESNYGPAENPVDVLDVPRMGYRTGESAKKKHAAEIAKLIKSHDPSWSGIIHVSSRYQARDLGERLARNGLQDRVYVLDTDGGTRGKIKAWHRNKKRRKNLLTITYSFHQGLDAPDDNINIVAKIPFKQLDDFGRAELDYNPALYRWNAAVKTEQACGRIRRGEPEHYETVGKPTRKVVAIADGNLDKVKGEMSDFFVSCFRKRS